MLVLCFSFLGAQDLCKASVVCKKWSSAAQYDPLWKRFAMRTWIKSKELCNIISESTCQSWKLICQKLAKEKIKKKEETLETRFKITIRDTVMSQIRFIASLSAVLFIAIIALYFAIHYRNYTYEQFVKSYSHMWTTKCVDYSYDIRKCSQVLCLFEQTIVLMVWATVCVLQPIIFQLLFMFDEACCRLYLVTFGWLAPPSWIKDLDTSRMARVILGSNAVMAIVIITATVYSVKSVIQYYYTKSKIKRRFFQKLKRGFSQGIF
jgi:hypothetical protein